LSTYLSLISFNGFVLDLARWPDDGAECGVCVDTTKSSSKLTPVALAIGIAILDPVRLGARGGFFKSKEKKKSKEHFEYIYSQP
jgi:hypothetical protein